MILLLMILRDYLRRAFAVPSPLASALALATDPRADEQKAAHLAKICTSPSVHAPPPGFLRRLVERLGRLRPAAA